MLQYNMYTTVSEYIRVELHVQQSGAVSVCMVALTVAHLRALASLTKEAHCCSCICVLKNAISSAMVLALAKILGHSSCMKNS